MALADVAGTIYRKALKSLKLRGVGGTLRCGINHLLRCTGQKDARPPIDDSLGRQFGCDTGTQLVSDVPVRIPGPENTRKHGWRNGGGRCYNSPTQPGGVAGRGQMGNVG
jgi:hypothetical protein